MATDIQKISILHKESIHCGFHLVPYIIDTVLKTLEASTYVLITDTHVAALHLDKFTVEFKVKLSNGSRFLSHAIPPGEPSKSREGKAKIEDFLLENACTRDTVIIALGGGVIGDLVGFVAATFMRGVRFVQVPTTLLAMVDSSIGGKTAIDTPHGKNLIGAFWQPEYIFIDAAFLETLPAREFSNGMAEVVKTAAIWNEDDFALLESRSREIFDAIQTPSQNYAGRQLSTRSESQTLLLQIIMGSISVKSHIVTIDERETGLRNLVNFGHSIGHAIEAVLTPNILHGECVSIGSILEAEISRQFGYLSQTFACPKGLQPPVSLKDPRIIALSASKQLSVNRLLDIMRIDKKNSGSTKKIVLLSRIGKTVEEKASAVPDEVIRRTLSEAIRIIPGIPQAFRMSTPGSKSVSNRALVLAALGQGTCRLKNLLHSDDTQVMMAALTDLQGAKFSWEDNGETLVVEGGRGLLRAPHTGKEIYLGNAGTAARFLTTLCVLAKGFNATIITGNSRMKQRPIGPLVEALRENGSCIQYRESEGCLPLVIQATEKGFHGGHIRLAANISSQYVSAILLCAPYAANDVVLELIGGQVISQPYIDMTIAMMRTFGVTVERDEGKNIYRIRKGMYLNPGTYAIESDASSATYPLAIAAITGTKCTIENIGKNSLQGDARFAKEVLEPMGCTVVQTETETTVTGPSVQDGLRAGGLINMEPMTDAFLTASVLAAVSKRPSLPERRANVEGGDRTTRIIGIANQRVKECNRIKAMIDELAKFGISTTELEDGLEVHGLEPSLLRQGVRVHCYDDHRVAMAFSVLATLVSSTTIEEKRCVEKTWPNWWDDLRNKIGISIEGVESQQPEGSTIPYATPDGSSSILLIGMRGAGKSYVGRLAAAVLGWKFVDADEEFAKKYPIGIKSFVQSKGWIAFRSAELGVLHDVLDSNRENCVISLGGGIVETPEARDILRVYKREKGPVVYIERDVDEIIEYLSEETARPNYGESIVDVFRRRESWYKESSNYVLLNQPMNTESMFQSPTPNNKSYFLSLTYPDVIPALEILDELCIGVDAIELRVDLLSADGISPKIPYIPSLGYVAKQLSALHHYSDLPIIFTVRTVSQGGMFPDAEEDAAFDLMELALRSGCEYIDVEITLSESRRQALYNMKGSSQIISSWHDITGEMKWDSQALRQKYVVAAQFGDIIKIVGKAVCLEDNYALRLFVTTVSGQNHRPIIAINMGAEGQMSRILNTTFSPVTHPLLPNKAAPGQLSVTQIQTALHLIGQLPAKKFYLFGSPISASMSPTLHNTGFKHLGLPHIYSLVETGVISDEIRSILKSPEFGGASVTIPLKLEVVPLLTSTSLHARAIGAINTIIVRRGLDGTRELHGDNTDWIGIVRCIRDGLEGVIPCNSMSLVIGGGGTSRSALYALHALGVPTIYLYNRTRGSAEALVSQFPKDYNIVILDSLDSFPHGLPSLIISTVPSSATSLTPEPGKIYLHAGLLGAKSGGIIVDMAYRPRSTPLIALARGLNGNNWRIVEGIDILLEQGFEQFERWTGMRPPREAIRRKVYEEYEKSFARKQPLKLCPFHERSCQRCSGFRSGSNDEANRARSILGFRPKTVTDQMVSTVQTMFPDIPRPNIHYDLLRTGSVELTSNKLLERGFLENPPRNYFELFPVQSATQSTEPRSGSSMATEPSLKTQAAPQTNLINRFHLEERIKDDSIELSSIDPGGKSIWEDTPERREQSLRERKAQMVLAARKKLVEQERRRQQNVPSQ
ncbi:hypothetical protein Clacol_007296 [Clathrus columnatus]|uniref:Pentafunctional AROM polypeptide n=1 Tax=Clathrus columnatus TaxID=1419009 RepID=A0AAV5AHC8_9AGAM|nr:hypothetical protein Clacol_007296 [Clathrus columnatus]